MRFRSPLSLSTLLMVGALALFPPASSPVLDVDQGPRSNAFVREPVVLWSWEGQTPLGPDSKSLVVYNDASVQYAESIHIFGSVAIPKITSKIVDPAAVATLVDDLVAAGALSEGDDPRLVGGTYPVATLSLFRSRGARSHGHSFSYALFALSSLSLKYSNLLEGFVFNHVMK